MRNPQLTEDQVYHVFNRGVEKRDVFLSEADYFRFVHDLYEMNDEAPMRNTQYVLNRNIEVRPRYIRERDRDPLVEILVFTLMPNHFHLLVRQRREAGIARFMQKLGTGYTMYFNKKYERVGGLFQGGYKAVHVHREAHFLYLPFYIHANPLQLHIRDYQNSYRGRTSIEAMRLLKRYRWSSFPDYINKKNFPSVTERTFLLDVFGGPESYRKFTLDLLAAKQKRLEAYEVLGDAVIPC